MIPTAEIEQAKRDTFGTATPTPERTFETFKMRALELGPGKHCFARCLRWSYSRFCDATKCAADERMGEVEFRTAISGLPGVEAVPNLRHPGRLPSHERHKAKTEEGWSGVSVASAYRHDTDYHEKGE